MDNLFFPRFAIVPASMMMTMTHVLHTPIEYRHLGFSFFAAALHENVSEKIYVFQRS